MQRRSLALIINQWLQNISKNNGMLTMLLETIGNINDEEQQIKHRRHEILMCKPLLRKKEKNHGYRPANLYYIG